MKEWMKKIVKFLIKFIASTAILFMVITMAQFAETKENCIINAEIKNTIGETKITELETTLDGEPIVKSLGITLNEMYEHKNIDAMRIEQIKIYYIFDFCVILGLIIAIALSIEGKVGKYISMYIVGYISITTLALVIAIRKSYFIISEIYSNNNGIFKIGVPIFIGYTVLFGLIIFIKSILNTNKK